jgi:hypothetical protein
LSIQRNPLGFFLSPDLPRIVNAICSGFNAGQIARTCRGSQRSKKAAQIALKRFWRNFFVMLAFDVPSMTARAAFSVGVFWAVATIADNALPALIDSE